MLLDQLTSEQLAEWEAYDKIDPIGTWRDDYRMAILDSLIVNIVNRLHAQKGHSPKEVTPMDFMPNWTGDKQTERRQTVDEMKTVLYSIAAAARQQELQDERALARSKIPPATMHRPPIQRRPPPMRRPR